MLRAAGPELRGFRFGACRVELPRGTQADDSLFASSVPLCKKCGKTAAPVVGWGGYWKVAAVGSVFDVAMCTAMGTLEVASV